MGLLLSFIADFADSEKCLSLYAGDHTISPGYGIAIH